ncbi:MAG: hypothetical protein AAB339_06160 [Elusimicrobiota bacterium]
MFSSCWSVLPLFFIFAGAPLSSAEKVNNKDGGFLKGFSIDTDPDVKRLRKMLEDVLKIRTGLAPCQKSVELLCLAYDGGTDPHLLTASRNTMR